MGEELELFGPFEVDPANGQPMGARLASGTPLASHAAAGALPEINA
jgi:hypothetical protein